MAKILVVDDELEIREVLSDLLTQEGFETLEAEDGITAVELVRKHSAAVVVLDLNLPGLSGMEVLRQTSEVPRRAPVIMLTGVDDLRTAVEAMQLGAYDYLTKPPDPAVLKLQISRAFERQTLLAEIDDLKTRVPSSERAKPFGKYGGKWRSPAHAWWMFSLSVNRARAKSSSPAPSITRAGGATVRSSASTAAPSPTR